MVITFLSTLVIAVSAQPATDGMLIPVPVENSNLLKIEIETRKSLGRYVLLPYDRSETISHVTGAVALDECAEEEIYNPGASCLSLLSETSQTRMFYMLRILPSSSITLTEYETQTLKSRTAHVAAPPSYGERTLTDHEAAGYAEGLVVQLFEPDAYTSSVTVSGDAGCTIRLDDMKTRVLPLDAPITGVIPGEHTVTLSCSDGRSLNMTSSVAYGQVAAFDFTGQEAPEEEATRAEVSFGAYVMAAGAAVITLGFVVTVAGVAMAIAADRIWGDPARIGMRGSVQALGLIGSVAMVAGVPVATVGIGVLGAGGLLMFME